MKRYLPDMSSLTTWDKSKRLKSYPMLAIFEFDDKRLLYVGTAHNNSYTKSPKSFDAINYVFTNFIIDCVVTEFPHHYETIEEDITVDIGKDTMSELAYSAYVASRKNIPYVFADTNDVDWIQDFSKRSKSEAIKLQTMWILNDAMKYKNTFHKNDTIEHAFNNYKYKLSKLGYNMAMSINDFKECCEKYFGFVVSDNNISEILNNFTDWYEPKIEGHITNKIWAEIDLYSRDPYMINQIFKAINEHHTVLVTMGAGHYESQRLVFEKAFGKPKYIYSFPKSQRVDMIDSYKFINQSNSGYGK